MVEYHLGLTPGVIVALVLILVVLTAMLGSTVYIVWRSRPAALARAHQRAEEERKAAADIERGTSAGDEPHALATDTDRALSILKRIHSLSDNGATDTDGDESVDGSPELQTPPLPAHAGHAGSSTVNVIISPSVPHLFTLATPDGKTGAFEVRVTPPTPSQSLAALALKPERRVRFEALPGAQGENESVWWFI